MSTEFPTGDFQDDGTSGDGGALRAWAEKMNKQNKELQDRLEKLESERTQAQVSELFDGYDPRVKNWIPKDADPKVWLEENKDILPRVDDANGAGVQAGAQAGQVPNEVQQGLSQIDRTMSQDTATGPGGATQFGQANLNEALNNGGLAELNRLLTANGLSGGVV